MTLTPVSFGVNYNQKIQNNKSKPLNLNTNNGLKQQRSYYSHNADNKVNFKSFINFSNFRKFFNGEAKAKAKAERLANYYLEKGKTIEKVFGYETRNRIVPDKLIETLTKYYMGDFYKKNEYSEINPYVKKALSFIKKHGIPKEFEEQLKTNLSLRKIITTIKDKNFETKIENMYSLLINICCIKNNIHLESALKEPFKENVCCNLFEIKACGYETNNREVPLELLELLEKKGFYNDNGIKFSIDTIAKEGIPPKFNEQIKTSEGRKKALKQIEGESFKYSLYQNIYKGFVEALIKVFDEKK